MLDALNTCKRVVKKQHTLGMHSHRTLYTDTSMSVNMLVTQTLELIAYPLPTLTSLKQRVSG